MAFFHHGTIRKYTAAILDFFNDFEIQYENSLGESISKPIPLKYNSREKAKILDEYTTEQLLSGNFSVLPRASLSLQSMSKAETRITNKNNKINQYKTDAIIEFSYNSVPYEFTFEITVQCRGMNEASQIIEQIAPKFNPTVNIDVWDVANLNEPTRIPVRLTDVQISSEDYEELSTNIFTISFTLSLMGNLYPPIKSQERVKEFKIMMNQVDGKYYQQKEILNWDVNLDGYIMGGPINTEAGSTGGSYTNLINNSINYVTSVSFDTGTGVLSIARSGLSAVTVDIDGRYVQAPSSGAAGDILYHDGTSYVRLPKGTDGQVLKMVSGLPAWADPVNV